MALTGAGCGFCPLGNGRCVPLTETYPASKASRIVLLHAAPSRIDAICDRTLLAAETEQGYVKSISGLENCVSRLWCSPQTNGHVGEVSPFISVTFPICLMETIDAETGEREAVPPVCKDYVAVPAPSGRICQKAACRATATDQRCIENCVQLRPATEGLASVMLHSRRAAFLAVGVLPCIFPLVLQNGVPPLANVYFTSKFWSI